jgi:hypothetical protein
VNEDAMAINVDRSREKQEKGVWTKFQDSEFKVANSNSTGFQRQLTRLQAPYRKKIDKGTLDPKISRDILCQAMASDLLLDWKNVVDGTGQDVPYSKEIAQKALLNNDDLREYLQEFAMELENFRQEEIDAQGKS